MASVEELVAPAWPPLRHVRRGWEALTKDEQAEVRARIEGVLAEHKWGKHPRDSLLHLFTFLAQVETIAIEIPLRFLPHATPQMQVLLRRQLVDEVFHSALFSRLAHELALPNAQPPPPLASAERLLDRIRREPDLAVTATLLNLVAEGWIETLFKHALKWGIANAVFRAVLADEARHVTEAHAYMVGMDVRAAQAAVERFERGMAAVSAEPTVALAIRDLAGPKRQQSLARDLFKQHAKHLAEAGLEPSQEWRELQGLLAAGVPDAPMPTLVEDTEWRRLARELWQTPRDPTMQGDFDVPVGHIPRKVLTAVLVAAFGRLLSKHPELNRVVVRGQLWQLPYANVGVRVLLDDNELATVVVPEADKRSIRDIQRMLAEGIEQLRRNRREAGPAKFDAATASLTPPLPLMFAIGFSNAGKWGVVSGAGAFSGWISPSTDITVGVRRRLPVWRGVGYFPAWHVNIAAIQDHRVLDGRGSATTVTGLQEELSRSAVREILAAPDSLPEYPEAPPIATPAMAVLAFTPKYSPVVVAGWTLGALAVGAGVGIGAYYWYQQSQKVPPAATPPGKSAKTAKAPGSEEPGLNAHVAGDSQSLAAGHEASTAEGGEEAATGAAGGSPDRGQEGGSEKRGSTTRGSGGRRAKSRGAKGGAGAKGATKEGNARKRKRAGPGKSAKKSSKRREAP